MKNPVALIIGTRPEGIKMIPVYTAFKKAGIPVVLCSTAQHEHLLNEVFSLFDIQPDYHLGIGRSHQDLFHITTQGLLSIQTFIQNVQPSWIIVQGDTTTAFVAALAAFYSSVPVMHVEAGLRTSNVELPFPEELNRRFIDIIAKIHCAPHEDAFKKLVSEKTENSFIMCTGNTVVDALKLIYQKIQKGTLQPSLKISQALTDCSYRQNVLVTTHRRESFGSGTRAILQTVKDIAIAFPDIRFFYPYHPNPNILQALQEIDLSCVKNIYLTEPLSYKDVIYLLSRIDWVATDSGGIIEEAVTLSKPVLIMRNETERMEAVNAGAAFLVGTSSSAIAYAMRQLIENKVASTPAPYLYGDGNASDKIVDAFIRFKNEMIQRAASAQSLSIKALY